MEGDPQALSDSYLKLLGRQTQLLPGAQGLVADLAQRRRLGLVTNGLSSVQRPRLERSSIGHHFELLVISEEVGYAKPDRRIFDQALARMDGASSDEILMVGDNLVADIDGANRCGLATCWLNRDGGVVGGEIRATYEIHHLSELGELLEDDS